MIHICLADVYMWNGALVGDVLFKVLLSPPLAQIHEKDCDDKSISCDHWIDANRNKLNIVNKIRETM